MFLAMSLVDWYFIKGKIWVHWFGLFPWEYNLLSLFGYVRTEWHSNIEPWAHSNIFGRSLLNISAKVLLLCTTENREVSSTKSFTVDSMFSGKSFMYIRKKSEPRIDPCGTPALTGNHFEVWPLSNTLWNLFDKKLWISFSNESENPIDFSL